MKLRNNFLKSPHHGLLLVMLVIFCGLVVGWPLMMQAGTVNLEVGIATNTTTEGISYYIGLVYRFAAAIVGAVAVIMIVIGGIQYSTSAGNKAAMGSAKETITSAIIGLVIVLMSYLILGVFSSRFTNLAEPTLPDLPIPQADTGWQGNCPAGYAAFTTQTTCETTCSLQYHTYCQYYPAGNGKSEAYCCPTTSTGGPDDCTSRCETAMECFRQVPCVDLGETQCAAAKKNYCSTQASPETCERLFLPTQLVDNPSYNTATCQAKEARMNDSCRSANCGTPDFRSTAASKYSLCCSAASSP